MTIFQAGQLNTTALTVPGLYTVIVPPQNYLLNGVPTNVGAFVGSATWGPVNNPVGVSGVPSYTAIFGAPQNRLYDMGTHVQTASMQGNAGIYKCVRVTDGTDAAASALVGGGSAGTHSSGTITFTVNPTAAQTATFGGTVVTFVASGATGLQVNIGANLAATIASLVALLNTSSDVNISVATWAGSATVLTGTAKAFGTTTFVMTTTVTSATAVSFSGGTADSRGVVLTSIYTGTGANADTYALTTGSAANSFKLVLTHAGAVPEIFDNLAVGLAGNAIWVAIAQAVNAGSSPIRGKSQVMTAFAGGSSTAPSVPLTGTLSGGLDGAAAISGATLLGVDTLPRTGMYALRAQGVSIAALCDCSDWTTFSTQVAFGLGEGIYMVATTPSGDSLATAMANKQLYGIDSYAMRINLGDWIMINDTTNGLLRFVSPQGFIVGMLANLSPQQSTLNKPIQGIVTTQKNQFGSVYASADLQALTASGTIDVITNPIPAGNLFGERLGRNSSSNAVIHGDNYTRMTNYLAATINAGMGIFIGYLQGTSPTDTTRLQAKATLDAFGQALVAANMIVAWQTVLDLSNNPPNQIALGYMQAYVKVTYLSVVEYFIISLEGGQSVTITTSQTAPF